MPIEYSKTSTKTLDQQIDVVAQFHAHNIRSQRIAFRTGIDIDLVNQLIQGEIQTGRFKAYLAKHRKNRRDQRLKKSLRSKGVAQVTLQEKIEQEYSQSINKK